jgi:hypothetical protein
MPRKILFAAVLAPLLLASPLAEAHGIHRGPYLQFEFGEYTYPEPSWVAGGISCRGGWRIVEIRGFDGVRPLDCDGRIFVYEGGWRGDLLRVHVDSKTGMIRGVTH